MALTPEALATLAAAAELLNAAGLDSTQLLAYEFATTQVKEMAEQDPEEAAEWLSDLREPGGLSDCYGWDDEPSDCWEYLDQCFQEILPSLLG